MESIEIINGSIVKYKSGYYRISCIKGGKVNLRSIFRSTISFKGVPLTDVVEAQSEWFASWTQSETYICM